MDAEPRIHPLAMKIAESPVTKFEAERAELDAVLSSGMLGRASNLARFLNFICEKYFEGAVEEVKEYSIAVHALGRPAGFDPQVDTIVRVTAHALRKRLEYYYQTAGAEHSLHVYLPPGHYFPKFVRKSDLSSETFRVGPHETDRGQPLPTAPLPANGSLLTHQKSVAPRLAESEPGKDVEQVDGGKPARESKPPFRISTMAALSIVSAFALSALGLYVWSHKAERRPRVQALAAAPASVSGNTIRVMVGDSRAPYSDRAGFAWESDHFCSGGVSFSVTKPAIQGTGDPQLFLGGRRGIFHCGFPVPPGTYEVHLLFAETSMVQENARNVAFSMNGEPASSLDVVDDAGGDDIAITKVFTDVAPENDGTIHLDFTSPESILNAVEILPGTPHRMLPTRIIAGHSGYRDSKGNLWLPDRYFFGGRLTRFGGDLSGVLDGGLYEWQRIGHFHYVVPVAASKKYTVRLHFMEHWFGAQNGNIGGVGSRVFDVSCNGSMLLKRFDILREAGSGASIKSFAHIEPTAQGKIEIYFTPAVNYPSVNAIEIIPE